MRTIWFVLRKVVALIRIHLIENAKTLTVHQYMFSNFIGNILQVNLHNNLYNISNIDRTMIKSILECII